MAWVIAIRKSSDDSLVAYQPELSGLWTTSEASAREYATEADANAVIDAGLVPVGAGQYAVAEAGEGTEGVSGSAKTMQLHTIPLVGDDIHGELQSWQNGQGAGIYIVRAWVQVITPSGSAGTIDVGMSEGGSAATSDDLFDGINAEATPGLYELITGGSYEGGSLPALLDSNKWLTMDEASGDVSDFVGNLIIEFFKAT